MLYLMLATLIVFVGLQVYDFWSTLHILQDGGRETNRIMAKAIGAIGVIPTLIIVKGGISAAAVVFAWMLWTQNLAWFGALLFGGISVVYCIKFRKSNFKYDGLGRS